MNFKINSRPLFTVIFKLKNDNFKTRDFSPLIERVLAGVAYYSMVVVEVFCGFVESREYYKGIKCSKNYDSYSGEI